MPHWRTLIEKDYLGAWSLLDPKTGAPREWTGEIEKVAGEKLKTRQQPKGKGKLVIRLKGVPKGFVCNTTNAETIARLYGDDTAGWIGKKITLYIGKARNPEGGEEVAALRVRPRVPGGPATALQEGPVDEALREKQQAAFDPEPTGGS